MHIPGVTADHAIAADGRFHHSGNMARRCLSRGAIYPALPPSSVTHGCSELCGGDRDCYQQCLAGLGPGGSPRDPGNISCLVGCGQNCITVGGRRVRACVNEQCNVHYISC